MSNLGFQISIIAGKDEQSSSVTASGQTMNVVTDEERSTFKLNDPELIEALIAGNGREPTGAWLRDPTPDQGAIYEKYDWPQTKTIMNVLSAEIVGVTSEPVILKTQEFVNRSSKDVTYNVSISESVTDTFSSEWSKEGTLTVGQSISYEVGFLGTGSGGETSFEYSQSWGESSSHSKEVTIGSESGVEVTLAPGEQVTVELAASRGVMNVRVRYTARLSGNTSVYYNPQYKGHNYYSFATPVVMSNTDISNTVVSTEDIQIDYFSNGRITVVDGISKKVKESFNVESPLIGNQESIVKK